MSGNYEEKYPFVSRSVTKTFGNGSEPQRFLYSKEVKKKGEEIVDLLSELVGKEKLKKLSEDRVNFALWQAALISDTRADFAKVFRKQLGFLEKRSKECSDTHKRVAQVINFYFGNTEGQFSEITILSDDLENCSVLSEMIEHPIKVLAMGGKSSARFNPKGFSSSLKSLLALEREGHTVMGEGTDIRGLVPIFCDVMVILDSKLSVEEANQVNATLVVETEFHQAGMDTRQLLKMRDVDFVPALVTRLGKTVSDQEFEALLDHLDKKVKKKRQSFTRVAYDEAAKNLKKILGVK